MMTEDEIKESLRSMKRSLINAHDEIVGVADFMETRLTTEYDRVEKARLFDPLGHAGFDPLGKIVLTL